MHAILLTKHRGKHCISWLKYFIFITIFSYVFRKTWCYWGEHLFIQWLYALCWQGNKTSILSMMPLILFHHQVSPDHNELTLNVRGPSYPGLTRSISWLLMPWLLTSPGHQQPWYWLYRICRSFSYLRKCFKYLCQINVVEWHKMQINVYAPSEKFST